MDFSPVRFVLSIYNYYICQSIKVKGGSVMKSVFADILNRVLAAVLALLGFAACGEKNELICEYGTPSVSYRIMGTVTDENNAPIKGIKVVISDEPEMESDDITVYTDVDGKFTGPHTYSFSLYGQTVSFEDVDGEDNGGLFKSATLGLDDMTTEKVKDGNGHWYSGDYEVIADVKLENVR